MIFVLICISVHSTPPKLCPDNNIPDTNECLEDPCLEEADCENSEGSFNCVCKNGLRGNGIDYCLGIDHS